MHPRALPATPRTRLATAGDGRADSAPLAGCHALVTGASRGIGEACAARLAALGARVTVIARHREALEAARERSGAAAAIECDVSDEEALGGALARAVAEGGPVDVLVNNAGAAESAPLGRTDRALWERMLAVNLTAAFLCARALLGPMRERGFGRVVNIASTAGLRGYPYVSAYCAAKHGLVGLTRALAAECGGDGVTVNAVCPGFTDTELLAASARRIAAETGRSEAEARAALAAGNPHGRLIAPGEVAATVAWLCLPEAAAVNGQALAVAGGEPR